MWIDLMMEDLIGEELKVSLMVKLQCFYLMESKELGISLVDLEDL